MIEAYETDGWRGAARERFKPTADLARAHGQVRLKACMCYHMIFHNLNIRTSSKSADGSCGSVHEAGVTGGGEVAGAGAWTLWGAGHVLDAAYGDEGDRVSPHGGLQADVATVLDCSNVRLD